ncbi:MAG: hypothetical protein IJG33_09165 [Selenomonadaceae bacterium]|nr:hypothetical protein [Selenomonadaceae bacterium]
MHANSTNDVIYGGGGNDFIGTTGNTRNPTIYGGKGSDTVWTKTDRTYADGGDDNDLFIPLNSAKNITLTGGEGNDTFWFIESSSVSISGGSGRNLYRFDPFYQGGPYHNDLIITDLSNNDTIRLDEYKTDGSGLEWRKESDYIVLEDGDFRLFTITLQGVTDISQIAGVTYRTIDRTITLGELFDVDTTPPDTTPPDTTPADSTLKTGTPYADIINNTLDGAIIYGLGGSDSITNTRDVIFYNGGNNVFIDGGDGNDFIQNEYGHYVTLNGGAGSDLIYNTNSQYVVINAGTDDDFIGINGSYATIDGGSGDDYMDGRLYDSSINGGDGDDTIECIGSGTGNTISGGAGDDYVDLTDEYDYDGKKHNNLIKYANGDGNDKIVGFDSTSTLQIGGGTGTYSSTKRGSDIIVTVGTGKITLQGAASLDTLNIDGTKKSSPTTTTLKLTNSDKSSVTIGSAIKTVNASARTKAIKITGNSLANTISGGSSEDTIYGGSGNDSIVGNAGNDKLYGQAGNDYLSGGSGNDMLSGGTGDDKLLGGSNNDSLSGGDGKDTLSGGTGDDKLLGGAGNDSLSGGDGKDTLSGGSGNDKLLGGSNNDCIKGGSGNDSLWGGAGADKFIYAEGDGKDIIYGFENSDTLTLDGLDFTSSYSDSKGTLALTFDEGSITFKNFTAMTFHIDGNTYKISGSKLVKK